MMPPSGTPTGVSVASESVVQFSGRPSCWLFMITVRPRLNAKGAKTHITSLGAAPTDAPRPTENAYDGSARVRYAIIPKTPPVLARLNSVDTASANPTQVNSNSRKSTHTTLPSAPRNKCPVDATRATTLTMTTFLTSAVMIHDAHHTPSDSPIIFSMVAMRVSFSSSTLVSSTRTCGDVYGWDRGRAVTRR